MGLTLEELKEFDKGEASAPPFQQIALDTYSIIADWYHYAILELIKIDGFQPDIGYIAKALGISRTEVTIAVERLKRVGLLEIRDNKWIDTSSEGNLTNINGELTNQASKILQRQVLELSILALDQLPISERNHTSMTMAINPEDLPKAKEKVQKFRRELSSFFEKNQKLKRVYHLGISLYPVSGREEES